jgi:hypothetical protein
MVNPDPIPPVPVVKWTWDKQHLFIIAAYAYGAFQTLYPIILAISVHGTPSPWVFLGIAAVLLSSVAAFLKTPPNSIESAIDAGKISVGQATTILAKRVSIHPPPPGQQWPSGFPKASPTIVEESDPDKTKQF